MRPRPEEANGHADEGETDLLTELVDRIRGIDHRLGESPDHATGHPGSGLCKVVAELKAESDYQARRREERQNRALRWRGRIQTAYSLVAAMAVLCATGWAAFKFLVMLSR